MRFTMEKQAKYTLLTLLFEKKSTRNLNKLFHKFSILICVFFVFLWHVLNFSYACYHTNICIRVNGVHEIAHLQFYCDCPCVCVPFFYNQIIDGNMSIIQLTAFLFIEWKYTKKNTYEICAHKIIRKQKKTTTNIKTIKCYSYWMIVKHTLIIKENQFFSFSLSSFINEFVSYENCNYFSNGRRKKIAHGIGMQCKTHLKFSKYWCRQYLWNSHCRKYSHRISNL